MQIDERSVGNVIVLDLKGSLTLAESNGLLKDKINSLINQGRGNVVLNMANVAYIDSAGLGEIFGSWIAANRQQGRLVFLNLTKRISDLLAITKLITVVEIYES